MVVEDLNQNKIGASLMKKRLLFFFAHPAKFHLFRVTINRLIELGNQVDIVITGRSVLEDLVRSEGWQYSLIFPRGRKIRGLPTLVSAIINSIRTILKLLRIVSGKKYDLFLTSDFLTFVGRIKCVPSILFTDDDLRGAPHTWILLWSADHIVAPLVCDLGRYNKKKIGFFGYKALAHLHPNHFSPDPSVPRKYGLVATEYFFVRTVLITSHHDSGMKGIGDHLLRRLLNQMSQFGRVILNSERPIESDLQSFELDFEKPDLPHLLAFAKIVISDSSTVCAEAAMLGVPTFEYNNWTHLYNQAAELQEHGLIYYTFDENALFGKMDELLAQSRLKDKYRLLRNQMLAEKIDISAFFIWLITNYPISIEKIKMDPSYQLRFK